MSTTHRDPLDIQVLVLLCAHLFPEAFARAIANRARWFLAFDPPVRPRPARPARRGRSKVHRVIS